MGAHAVGEPVVNGPDLEVDGLDSAGRPVRISSGATVFWEASVPSGAVASYDALGRVPQMKADTGQSDQPAHIRELQRRPSRGVQALHELRDIFATAGATYQGTKLAGYNDGLTQTSYANTYWSSGRLKRADASPYSGTTPGPMTQDYTHDHVFDGLSNLGSVTEVKNARTPGMPVVQRTRTPSYNSTGDQMASLTTELTVDGAMRQSCTATFTYDAQGRMATRGGTAEVFSYDLQGHLTRVTRAGVVAETLGYGPTGELLWRQVGSRYLFYVGEYATVRAPTQGNVTTPGAPVNGSALEVDAHVLWVGARIASVAVAGLGGRTLFYYRTRLGSVVATSVGGGVPGAMYRYTPYGMVDKASNETASTASDLGYTGALRLTGNLVYLRNRVYHAGLKVFLQPDSVDRLRYAYVAGDPANASDPTGLLPLSFAQVFGSAATGWKDIDDASNQGKESVLDRSSPESAAAPAAEAADGRPTKDGTGLNAEAKKDANGHYRMDDSGKEQLKKLEGGFHAYPYDDKHPNKVLEPGDEVDGVLTIGFGHVIRGTEAKNYPIGEAISVAQANTIFENDVRKLVNPRLDTIRVPGMAQNQVNALGQLAFNTQLGANDVIRELNRSAMLPSQSNFQSAIIKWFEFRLWEGKKSAGMEARRQAEINEFVRAGKWL